MVVSCTCSRSALPPARLRSTRMSQRVLLQWRALGDKDVHAPMPKVENASVSSSLVTEVESSSTSIAALGDARLALQ